MWNRDRLKEWLTCLTEQENGNKTFNTLKGTIIALPLTRSDQNLEFTEVAKKTSQTWCFSHWSIFSDECRCNFVSGTNKRLIEAKELFIV